MNPDQQLTLWIGSFRYYLGRRTYAVSDFVELLISEWGNLPDSLKDLIAKELLTEIKRDDDMRSDPVCSSSYYPLGDDCDRREWERLLPLINRKDAK